MTSEKAAGVFETLSETAQQPDAITNFVHEGMHAVEKVLLETVNSEVDVLRDASRHILGAGGKRIRPRLVLLGYATFGGRELARVAPVAAAIELVHTASVVHDDINDHGILRRGRPSINAVWGRTFALLTGDFLFTKVYELMSPYKDLNIVLAEATSALVEGETLQASAVKDRNFSRETYFKIIARKTAALFRAAGSLGARLADATDRQVSALEQYGYHIGLAFQIVDDILDLTADSDQLGKTAGLDLQQGKGFATVNAAGRTVNGLAVSDGIDDDVMTAIKRKALDGSTIGEGRNQAKQLVHVALHNLNVLPSSPGRAALIDLAQSVVERDY